MIETYSIELASAIANPACQRNWFVPKQYKSNPDVLGHIPVAVATVHVSL